MLSIGVYLSEFLGTLMLVLLGNGVVSNVVLNKSKGQGSGWIVITTGWGLAVAVSAYTVGWVGGAHLNPALTIALAVYGTISWSIVPGYIMAQFLGAFCGAVLVYLTYKNHFDATDDADAKLACFCTGPAIRNKGWNIFTEIIGTAMLVLALLGVGNSQNGMGALGALVAGFVVWSIGLSLGGPTGYAINPARDLGPRIAHAVLSIKGKRDSDWSYAIVPVIGPIIGGIIGAVIYKIFLNTWI